MQIAADMLIKYEYNGFKKVVLILFWVKNINNVNFNFIF